MTPIDHLAAERARVHAIAALAKIRTHARIQSMTPEQYYTRHERRPAPDRTDRLWTIAIIVGIFVAGALAGAIAP